MPFGGHQIQKKKAVKHEFQNKLLVFMLDSHQHFSSWSNIIKDSDSYRITKFMWSWINSTCDSCRVTEWQAHRMNLKNPSILKPQARVWAYIPKRRPKRESCFNYKKEESPTICDSKDELWRHYSKLKKSGKDKYYIILLTCGILKKQMHRNRSQIGGCRSQKVGSEKNV